MATDQLNIIPSDGGSVFDVLQRLSNSQEQIALIRPNNPPRGIAGFLFDIVGDETMDLVTNTTDHYAEDNLPLQDQATLSPEKFTVSGFVGELVLIPTNNMKVVPVQNSLPDNPAFQPALSPGAEQTLVQTQETDQLQDNGVESGQSLYGFYQQLQGDDTSQSRQTRVFGYIYQLWKGRQLFTVETPWGVLTSMIIDTVRSEQSEDTRFRSDMTITFKKIRTAQAASVDVGTIAGRAQYQRADVTQNGAAGTPDVTDAQNQSFLYQLTNPGP